MLLVEAKRLLFGAEHTVSLENHPFTVDEVNDIATTLRYEYGVLAQFLYALRSEGHSFLWS